MTKKQEPNAGEGRPAPMAADEAAAIAGAQKLGQDIAKPPKAADMGARTEPDLIDERPGGNADKDARPPRALRLLDRIITPEEAKEALDEFDRGYEEESLDILHTFIAQAGQAQYEANVRELPSPPTDSPSAVAFDEELRGRNDDLLKDLDGVIRKRSPIELHYNPKTQLYGASWGRDPQMRIRHKSIGDAIKSLLRL